MQWRSPKVVIPVGIALVLLIASGTIVMLGWRPSENHAAAPTNIPGLPSVTATPIIVTAVPTSVHAALFVNPSEPAFVPGKGLSPDAQRIIDIVMLQTFLERYRAMQQHYPASLTELFPNYADDEDGKPLAAQPTDPATHAPYTYQVSPDGATYRLSATLSSGKQYNGVAVDNP